MIGVLLLSHGEMAKGMMNTISLFFGNDIPGLQALCLSENDQVEEFDERIRDALQKLDDGSGVFILCDLYGGTPSNRCAFLLSDRIKVISGINLSLIIELLGIRLSVEDVKDINIPALIETSQKGIICLNDIFQNIISKQQ